METPSSASKISPNSGHGGFNDSSGSRVALFDISNDSPVVGLTVRTKTSSRLDPNGINVDDESLYNEIDRSGEALLRRQVKSLLRNIDEEDQCSYDDDDDQYYFDDSLSVSPAGLLAPGDDNKKEEEQEEAVLRYHGSNGEQIPQAR